MTIFNDTNKGRVAKIQELLGLIKKSVVSNKASEEDAWQLLNPAIEDISDLVGVEAQEPEQAEPAEAPEAVQAPSAGETTPKWFQMHQWAHEMPLHELNRVVAVYVNRVDEELPRR